MAFDQLVTFIYVSDLDKSAAFYEAVLQLELWLDQGACRIYKVSATGFIGICQANDSSKGQPPADAAPPVILTLVTHDVHAWYQQLKAKWHNVGNPPEFNADYNIFHFFIHDPDGYLIEIQRFGIDHPRD